MADSTSTPSTSNNTGTVAHSSCFIHTVTLYDWWLIKAENDFQGKWLAVSGNTSNTGAVRVFVSAAITKRHDAFSLETADGICIFIKRFIDEKRTLENGFSPEVFNSFLFGFPENWESYAADWFRDESTTAIDLGTAVPENVSVIDPKILSDGAEKSAVPTSSKSLEEALRDHERSFPEDECHVSKDKMGGVNVAHGSGSNRRSTRLRDIKVCQQKKPASAAPPKHQDRKQHSSSRALENRDVEELKSPVTPAQSQSLGQDNTPFAQLVKNLTSLFDPKILSNGVEKSIPTSSKSPEEASGNHEKPFPKDVCNVSKEITGGVNVAHGSGCNRHSTRSKKKRASRAPPKHSDKEQYFSSGALENRDAEGLKSPVTPVQSQLPGQVNTPSEQLVENLASAIDPEILSDGVEKSIPSSSKSPEEALRDHEKPFSEDECHASTETTGGVNVAHGSGSNRRSTRLRDIKVCQQKKPASAAPLKHQDKNQHSSSGSLENRDVDELKSRVTPSQSQSLGQDNTPFAQLVRNLTSVLDPKILSNGVEKSIPTATKFPEEALGNHEKIFHKDECHVSNEITGGVNVVLGSGSNRRSTRLRNIKVSQQKKSSSRAPPKHLDKEQHYSLGALENPDTDGLKSPVTPIQPLSLGQGNLPSEQLIINIAPTKNREILSDGVEKSIPTSKSPEEAVCEKPFPEKECRVSKEITGGINAVHGSGSNRCSTRSRNIKVCQQKKRSSSVPLKHPNKKQQSSSGTSENPDGEGLKSPVTPVQLQSLGQVNTPSEKLTKNSASRVSIPFSGNSEGRFKKKEVTVEAKATMRKRKMAVSATAVKYPCKRKMTGSASTVKYPRERDVSPLIKGGKEKISTVSPLSSSFKTSRSGRLLLPPLEFWRNQIPIYNADHVITEIRDGASVVSPSLKVFHHHRADSINRNV